jgi:hypothetical protein
MVESGDLVGYKIVEVRLPVKPGFDFGHHRRWWPT